MILLSDEDDQNKRLKSKVDERLKKRAQVREEIKKLSKDKDNKEVDKNNDLQEIEEYANGLERELDKELVEEEKRERMRIKKDIEEIK